MTAQLIPFEKPQEARPQCVFCKSEIAPNQEVLRSGTSSIVMCMPCVIKAKQRMEESDDGAPQV